VVVVALWKSSKSSSAANALDFSTAFPFPLDVVAGVVVEGSSSSKLNRSTTSFFGGGAGSFLGVDFLGTELLVTGARAPPSSYSSYSSNCAVREGRSWKSLPPE
jgi:hypothetical protein